MLRIFSAAATVIAMALATPATAGGWGEIYSAVTLASDYRYEGVSSSNGHAAVQTYVHLYRPDGWYAGVFFTQADYGYPQSPTYEVDTYGGHNWRLDGGKTELKLEAMYSAFPDNKTPGPTFNFAQVKAAAHRTEGPLSYGAAGYFVPNSAYTAGVGWRAEADAAYALSSSIKMRGLVGHMAAERGRDRSYWELAVAKTWRTFSFELRYVDNNLSRRECGFNPKICDATVVATVTASLPPIR